MLPAKTARRRFMSATFLMAVLCAAGALSSCRNKRDASFIGTFRMGEKVQTGALVYQVLQAEWRNELGSGGRTPKDRYLFIRLSVTNSSGSTVAAPALTIEGAGKTYSEVVENTENVDNWMGLLRNVAASQTEQGWIVFDAPVAAYKLVLEEGEVGEEKTAHVDIPVHLE
jgi:hypothetical protein